LRPGGHRYEGGWTVTAESDGSFTFHSPLGRQLALQPPREPIDDSQGWLREWAYRRKLYLGPEVNMPQWDGKHPDYAIAVGCLLEAG